MKKTKTRLLAALLCASMVELPAAAPVLAADTPSIPEESAQRYEIYPIPHSVNYAAAPEEITLGGSVNVVYESGIDQYTKDYLREILTENNLSVSESDALIENQANILIGIDDSNGVADEWFDVNAELSADLFTKTDAYALDVDKNGQTSVIAIVGKDTDAAYYALSSLDMMFSSFEGNKLIEVDIEDYADKQLRGFIEGFYGGFSYEARETQIRFLRKVKGNMYVFASKTDPYHGGPNWRETYPDEELAKIAHLVDVAKANKVRYCWSFHAGKSAFLNGVSADPSDSTYAQYQERLQELFAKFDQLYAIGVRDFHILNDDYNSGNYADVSLFLNDVNDWLKAKGDCGPLVFCPQNYTIGWGDTANEMAVHKEKLDKDILIYWTGNAVNCPVTQTDVDWLYTRSGNEVVNWINYPCSEHDKAGIYLGSIDNYFHNADNLQHTQGLMSNPVNYPEANKVAYFQLMSWLWNTQNFSSQVDTIWKNSFKYIEPVIADSYATVARHISNCPDSGRYPNGFPESEELQPKLEAAERKLQNGQADLNDPDIKAVYDEMKAVLAAVADMRQNGSEALLADLGPWLSSLEAAATAMKGVIESECALQSDELADAWAAFSKASVGLENWGSYPTPQYPEKMAKAASKRLIPSANRLSNHLSNNLLPRLNPSYEGFTPAAITSFPSNSSLYKMIDGDESTFASWNRDQVANDYYGIDLGRVMPVHDIEIIQGETDTHHDRFHESTLEYSLDGETWTAIEENINASRIVRDNLDIQARYVRLRVTGFTDPAQPTKHKFWTRVREFTVNKDQNVNEKVVTNQCEAGSALLTVTDSAATLSNLGSISLPAGASIGFELTDPVFASAIAGASLPTGVIAEYSLDGFSWSSDTIVSRETVRMARLRNTGSTAVTLTADSTLTLTKTNGAAASVSSELPLKQGSWANLVDGDLRSFAWTNVNQAAGQVISVDLGRELPFYAFSLYMTENRPRLYHGKVYVSSDNENWQEIMEIDAANDKTLTDGALRYQRCVGDGSKIRYIKLEVTDTAKEETTEQSAFLKLHEFRLNDAPLPADVPSLFTGTQDGLDAAADNDLSTAFVAAPNQAGSLEYVVPKNNDKRKVTIVQDPEQISVAKVEVLCAGSDEWIQIGTLDESVKTMDVAGTSDVLKIRVSWNETDPSPRIYEMMMTGEAKEPAAQIVNLALQKTVTSSGTEVSTGKWTADLAVDGIKTGDTSRWSAPQMKTGTSADQTQTPQWLQIDLGENCEIHSIVSSFYKKVYATDYDVLISDNGTDWTIVKAHAGIAASPSTMDPVETIEFETPITGRYLKFDYKSINHNAAGISLSVREIEVFGKAAPAAVTVDRSLLKLAIDTSNALDTSAFSLDDAQKTAWTASIAQAQSVYDEQSADQGSVNEAAAALNQKLLALRLIPQSERLADLPQ